MNKKALRKALEVVLVKTIEQVLHANNPEAGKKSKKIVGDSSKTIAKKFYKIVKSLERNKKTDTSKKPVKKPIKMATSTAKAKTKK